MSYNILNKNVKFAGSTQGTIEDVVDTHSNQAITGSKDFQTLTGSNVYVKSKMGVGIASPTYTVDVVPIDASALRIKGSSNGVNVNCAIENTGTGATDDTLLSLTTQGGAGDPSVRFAIAGNETYSIGIDNSDGDKFKISQHSTLHTDTRLTIQGGNVGIGIDAPSAKLDVNGSIKSTGITSTGTISGSGAISGSAFYGDGSTLSNVTTELSSAGGLSYDGSDKLRIDTTTLSLIGSVDGNADRIIIFDSDETKLKLVKPDTVAGLATAAISTFTNSGNADNRVVTSIDGSSVIAEPNLTFDGNDLSVTNGSFTVTAGNISGSGYGSFGGNVSGSTFYGQGISLANATGLAGAGLANNNGELDVQTSGSVKVASDRIGISGSLAGNGLSFNGGVDSIASLSVELQSNSGLSVDATGLKLNMNSLTTATPSTAADSITFIDSDGDKKCSFGTFLTAIAGANLGVSGNQLTASAGGAVSAVANGSDDRIATFSSSDALNGEANLTFNSSNLLAINGDVSGSGYMSASFGWFGTKVTAADIELGDATGLAGNGLANNGGELEISIHSPNPGLHITGSKLDTKIKPNYGISTDVDGIMVDLDSQGGIEFNSGALRLKSTVAGDGLSHNLGALSVDLDGLATAAPLYSADHIPFVDAGDNVTKKTTFSNFAATIAGDGLVNSSGRLEVAVTGAAIVVSDRVGISGSIAGNGLEYQGGVNSISALEVKVSDFMSNGSNNRIVTAGDANSMNAESNLNFDGTVLAHGGSAGDAGVHSKMVVRKTSISHNTATSIVTFTVPNASHAASVRVHGVANFDSPTHVRSFSYEGAIGRIAGTPVDKNFGTVTMVENAGITPNFTVAVSTASPSGGTSATQTFDMQLTISASNGSGSNATVMVELLNFNSSGITMAAS
tara:strand:+ start:2296 stop:5010 length:2715 start_codon:yes stop_codon:yes gene_type:complete